MEKIRIVIAHKNEQVVEKIVNSISELDYVEIVGTALDGIETYNKIIELKPEVVFSEYNFDNMKGLELLTMAKEKLQDKFPSFNTIGDIPDEELIQAFKITENKINASINQPYDNVKDILKAYKDYKYN